MIIAVTGTPGTGKDTVSNILGEKLGWEVVDLNKAAKEKRLYKGYDKKRKCDVVDLAGINSEIKRTKKDIIVQSHYSHELNPDLVIVLRTDPAELKKRLEKRRWAEEKIKENLEAEIMEVCKNEALQKTRRVFEVDTTEDTAETSAEKAIDIIFREGIEIKKDLKIHDRLLERFKKPYGNLFGSAGDFLKSGIWKATKGLVIAVGDQSSYNLLEAGLDPDLIVVDGKVNRKPFSGKIGFRGKGFQVINRPGRITRNLWNTMRKGVVHAEREAVKIIVMGEDDLAVLPAVLMAPAGSVVLYGQPEVIFRGERIRGGLIAIKVDLEKKKDSLKLLREMEKIQ